MRISDWSSDVCSSDLREGPGVKASGGEGVALAGAAGHHPFHALQRHAIVFIDVAIDDVRDRRPAAVPADHADIGMLPVDRHAVRGDDRQSVVEYGPGQAVVLDEIPVAWADGDIAE